MSTILEKTGQIQCFQVFRVYRIMNGRSKPNKPQQDLHTPQAADTLSVLVDVRLLTSLQDHISCLLSAGCNTLQPDTMGPATMHCLTWLWVYWWGWAWQRLERRSIQWWYGCVYLQAWWRTTSQHQTASPSRWASIQGPISQIYNTIHAPQASSTSCIPNS